MSNNPSFAAGTWTSGLALMAQNAHVAVGVSRLSDGVCVEVNDAFCRLFQLARHEVLGRSSREFDIWHDPAQRDRMLELLRRHGHVTGFEANYRTRLGEVGVMQVSAQLVEHDGTPHVVGFLTEVTGQHEVIEGLRVAQARLGIVLRASGTLVFRQDPSLRYTWVANPALGATEDELLGRNDDEIMGAEAAAPLVAIKRRVLESGRAERRDVWVGHKGQRRCFDLVVEPERDATGRVIGIVCAALDITARMAPAPDALADGRVLDHAQRALQAPLNAIEGLTALIGREPLRDRQAERLQRLAFESRHLAELLASVLLLVRHEQAGRETGARDALDVNRLSADVVESLRPHARARLLDLAFVAATPCPDDLLGDAAAWHGAVNNLLHGAIRALPPGRLWLSQSVTACGPSEAELRVELDDRGPGIALDPAATDTAQAAVIDALPADAPPALRAGLVLARRLARSMGGEAGCIWHPAWGHGLWFTARLARRGGDFVGPLEQAGGAALSALRRHHAGTRVLVAADNAVVREQLCALLESARLQVVAATTGVEAFSLALRHDPALVLLDVELPQRGGVAAARAIRAMATGQPPIVAMISGLANREAAHLLDADLDDVIPKPMPADRLYDKVLAWLTAR